MASLCVTRLILGGILISSLSAPFILTSVNGYNESDPRFKQYLTFDGQPVDYETNLMMNSCILSETPNKMILDSRGLEGTILDPQTLFGNKHHNYNDPCKQVADQFVIAGWTIDDIDRSDGETIITLVK